MEKESRSMNNRTVSFMSHVSKQDRPPIASIIYIIILLTFGCLLGVQHVEAASITRSVTPNFAIAVTPGETTSSIDLSSVSIPAGAKIDYVDVSWNIDHNWLTSPSDVQMRFGTGSFDSRANFGWTAINRTGSGNGGYSHNSTSFQSFSNSALASQAVNQIWYFIAQDRGFVNRCVKDI